MSGKLTVRRGGVKMEQGIFELLGSLTNVNQGQEVAAAPKSRKQPKPINHLQIARKINEMSTFFFL